VLGCRDGHNSTEQLRFLMAFPITPSLQHAPYANYFNHSFCSAIKGIIDERYFAVLCTR
jgi:hypothetical protein